MSQVFVAATGGKLGPPSVDKPLGPKWKIGGKCFKSQASMEISANATKCPEGYHLQKFTIQGKWKDGKEPGQGWVPPSAIDTDNSIMPFPMNFTNICENGFCFGMNQCAYTWGGDPKPNDKKMSVTLCPSTKQIEPSETFPALLWCFRCVPCRSKSGGGSSSV